MPTEGRSTARRASSTTSSRVGTDKPIPRTDEGGGPERRARLLRGDDLPFYDSSGPELRLLRPFSARTRADTAQPDVLADRRRAARSASASRSSTTTTATISCSRARRRSTTCSPEGRDLARLRVRALGDDAPDVRALRDRQHTTSCRSPGSRPTWRLATCPPSRPSSRRCITILKTTTIPMPTCGAARDSSERVYKALRRTAAWEQTLLHHHVRRARRPL